MSIEAMKLALENAQPSFMAPGWTLVRNEDITALRQAIEQTEQAQPVEHCLWARNGNTPCPHTTPPRQQLKNVVKVERTSDQSVKLVFTSCAAASEFEHGIKENT